MKYWLVGLVALTGVAMAAGPHPAKAQMFAPDWSDDNDDSYYGPGWTPPPYAYWGPPRAVRPPRALDPPPANYTPPPGMSYYAPPRRINPASPRGRDAGQCGTFHYWSNGQCVDSRLK